MKNFNEDQINKIFRSVLFNKTNLNSNDSIFANAKESSKNKSFNLILFFKYLPLSVYSAVTSLSLFLILSAYFIIFVPYTSNRFPIMSFSEENNNEIININKLIRVDKKNTYDMQIKNKMNLRFFEESEFVINSYSIFSKSINIELLKGKAYFNKYEDLDKKIVFSITADNYLFKFIGTRALISFINKNTLESICFKGKIEVNKLINSKWKKIYDLHENEKLTISLENQKIKKSDIMNIEKNIDNNNINLQKVTYKNFDILEKEKRNQLKKQIKNIKFIEQVNKSSLNNLNINVKDANAYIVYGDTLCLLSYNNKIINKNFSGINFTSKPIITDENIILVSKNEIYILSKERLEQKKVISIKDKGLIADNYNPVLFNNIIYFPLRNSGYYKLDLNKKNQELELIYNEEFPMQMIPLKDSFIVGSFYNNYIAKVNSKLKTDWKYTYSGTSYSNFILEDGNIYFYIYENDKAKIVKLNNSGIKEREWIISQKIKTDLWNYKSNIYFIDIDGYLNFINTDNNESKKVQKIINGNLSSHDWRKLSPLINENKLYIGTANGHLLIIECESGKILEDHLVDENKKFNLSPFIIKNTIYLISSDGSLYNISNDSTKS